MAMYKYRFHMDDFHPSLHHDVDGGPAAKIKILTTSRNSVLLTIRDREVVMTEDGLAAKVLEHYLPPKIPITHKGGEHWMYDHALHADKRPFVLVDTDVEHDHVI